MKKLRWLATATLLCGLLGVALTFVWLHTLESRALSLSDVPLYPGAVVDKHFASRARGPISPAGGDRWSGVGYTVAASPADVRAFYEAWFARDGWEIFDPGGFFYNNVAPADHLWLLIYEKDFPYLKFMPDTLSLGDVVQLPWFRTETWHRRYDLSIWASQGQNGTMDVRCVLDTSY